MVKKITSLTYINGTLIDTYTEPMATYGRFGIRENLGVEEAYFDNIVVTDTKANKVLTKLDFNDGVNPFADTSVSEIVNGIIKDSPALLISKCSGGGDTSILH